MSATRIFVLLGFATFVVLLLITVVVRLGSKRVATPSGDPKWALLLCFALVWYNVSTTWVAQMVMYPLFGLVGRSEFVTYHHGYSAYIPIPVIFPAVALSIASVLLLWFRPIVVPEWAAWTSVLLTVLM